LVAELYRFDEFKRLLDDAEAGAKTYWEEQFVADTKSRFRQYGTGAFLSSKQAETLEGIANR